MLVAGVMVGPGRLIRGIGADVGATLDHYTAQHPSVDLRTP